MLQDVISRLSILHLYYHTITRCDDNESATVISIPVVQPFLITPDTVSASPVATTSSRNIQVRITPVVHDHADRPKAAVMPTSFGMTVDGRFICINRDIWRRYHRTAIICRTSRSRRWSAMSIGLLNGGRVMAVPGFKRGRPGS